MTEPQSSDASSGGTPPNAPPAAPPVPPVPGVTPPHVKEPFGMHAAKFALYAPIVSLFIGVVANVALNNKSGNTPDSTTAYAWMGIAGLNLLLNVGAVIAGICAITAMFVQKLKPIGILLRSIVGMGLAGLILGNAVMIFAMPHRLIEATTRRVTGEWKAILHAADGVVIDNRLVLNPDQHASMYFVRDTSLQPGVHFGNDKIVHSMEGEWHVIAGRAMSDPPRLVIRWAPGQDPQAGEGIGWVIRDVNENMITLEGNDAVGSVSTENYQRVCK